MIKSLKIVAGMALVALFSLSAQSASEKQAAAIAERIKPVGEVCLEGDSNCGSAVAAASTGPRSGEDVYNAACMACHTTGAGGVASHRPPGAPRHLCR